MVTPFAKRQVVEDLVREPRLSVRRACRAVGLSRAAWYRPLGSWLDRDAAVIEALQALVEQHPRRGFWKYYGRLRLTGHGWNHKRVHRVYCALGLNIRRRTKRRVLVRPRQPLVAPPRLNGIWALDFMHDALYGGRPFRTLNVLDEANREALAIEIGVAMPATRVIRVLEQLVELHGKPQALRLDNGPELTAQVFTEWCAAQGIALRYIQPGKPNQNAFIERFNRTYRTEVLDAYLFVSITEVQEITDPWRLDYNEQRPHDSLGRVPPATFKPRPATPAESNNAWSP